MVYESCIVGLFLSTRNQTPKEAVKDVIYSRRNQLKAKRKEFLLCSFALMQRIKNEFCKFLPKDRFCVLIELTDHAQETFSL